MSSIWFLFLFFGASASTPDRRLGADQGGNQVLVIQLSHFESYTVTSILPGLRFYFSAKVKYFTNTVPGFSSANKLL